MRTIQRNHMACAIWCRLRFLDGVLEIRNKSIDHGYRQALNVDENHTEQLSVGCKSRKIKTNSACDMDGWRPTDAIQVPSPPAHGITHFKHVHARISRTKCNDGGWRTSQDIKFRNRGFDCVGDYSRASDDRTT